MTNKIKIENLGFTGGSVKGTAYVGVAKALYDTGVINDIQRVSGVSAGSIFATLLALDFSPEEMRDTMLSMDYNKFADGSFGNIGNLYRLTQHQGMHSGDYFYNWMRDLIKKRTGDGDMTFGEAHAKSDKYFDLYIASSNLNTQLLDVFSYEHTPDVKIVDAVRASMSIPFFFQPYKINGYTYGDGGLIDNYPIELFDSFNYDKDDATNGGYYYNESTLGFALTDPTTVTAYRTNIPVKVMNTESNKEIFKATINLLLNGAQLKEMKHEHSRTVYVDNLGIGMLDFDLTMRDKLNLVREGYTSTINYINDHNLLDNKFNINISKFDSWSSNNDYKSILDKIVEHMGANDTELVEA